MVSPRMVSPMAQTMMMATGLIVKRGRDDSASDMERAQGFCGVVEVPGWGAGAGALELLASSTLMTGGSSAEGLSPVSRSSLAGGGVAEGAGAAAGLAAVLLPAEDVGMTNCWPARIFPGSEILLAVASSPTVTPYFLAMAASFSPGLTVCVTVPPAFLASDAAVEAAVVEMVSAGAGAGAAPAGTCST